MATEFKNMTEEEKQAHFDKIEMVRDWIKTFNEIPTALLQKAYPGIKFPAWHQMWAFGEALDRKWARENIETIKACGFSVYILDDLGVVIGIDGSGYNFYEAHWKPLIEARIAWKEY